MKVLAASVAKVTAMAVDQAGFRRTARTRRSTPDSGRARTLAPST